MDFKEYFISKWPEEAVGYIKDGEFHPLENTAEDKLHTFEVDPTFMLDEPDALLHSHTVGFEVQEHDPRSPSYEDLKGQIATGIEWGICVTDGDVCDDPLWWGNPENRPELLERDFIFNLQDCFALCQDWYYQERKIVLPSIARTPFWNEEGNNYIEDNFEKWGFQQVDQSDLQVGDVIVYKVRSQVASHLGIYVGNDEVLSHWYGRVSCVESLYKWANYIAFVLRYAA